MRFSRVLAASLFLGAIAASHAAAAADFYRGRTMFVVIGFAPGGGYDLYARVLAQHMGRHIPGNPTLVPQNMPGAGSLKAANYIYSVAPKDGTVIGTFGREEIIAPLLNKATFDVAKFAWLGSVTKDTSVCISWYQSPIKTWNDAMTKPFMLGSDGAGTDPDNFALLYKNVFGAKIKLASGFSGTSEITLAMQRREVDGLCGLSWTTIKSHYADWVRDKKLNVLLQAADAKDPDLPDVPLASDFARTAEQRQILNFVVTTQSLARPFAAPPGTPADRMALLRTAFDQTMKDPAFVADAKKVFLDVNPVSATQVDALIASLYATPKDIVAKAAQAISR